MAVLTSRIDPASEEAWANRAAMRALVDGLRARTAAPWRHARISVMGGEQAAMVLGMVGTFKNDRERAAYETEIRAKYGARAIPITLPRDCETTA